MNNVGDTPMSVKTSLLTLQPSLTLLTLLFVGGLALVIVLTSVPTPAHARATTPSGYSAALWRADGQPIQSAGGQGDACLELSRRACPEPSRRACPELAEGAAIRSSDALTTYVYLPFIAKAEVCQPIPGESYGDLSVNGGPTDPPAEEHPDLNLALRGYEITDAYKGLVNPGGGGDPNAPQLPGLFADNRTATFSAVYQVYGWDWECNCRGTLITNPEVTLAGLAVTPGETIHVPDSGYTIGGGYEVLVLYATPDRITLKYTPDDHVIWGYTLHIENICVESSLLALYQSWNDAGRGRLPALRAGQAFGRARDSEIGVVIRDTGAFMDPRSRKDWWQGR
jgi:hypothetical protein